MKLLIFLSTCYGFCVILKAQEDDWTEVTDSNKSHLGYCYSDTDELGAMKKGERKRLKTKCVEAECHEGGLITFRGCHGITGDPLCKVGKTYLQHSFPECCPPTMCI